MKIKKEKRAIQILKTFEPLDEPYWLCYSGGKDSDVISILAKLAGVKHERHYNLTTVDSPVTVQYIKSQPDVIIDKARWPDGRHKTMSNLIEHNGVMPTRLMRFCCSHLKEAAGKGHLKITGVRAAESVNRAKNAGLVKIFGKFKTTQKIAEENGAEYNNNNNNAVILNYDNAETRRTVEQCYRTTSTMVNPILDWTEEDVWSFLKHYGCESNPEYQNGQTRIGCIGCPMAGGQRLSKFQQYPKYFGIYWRACAKAMKAREAKGYESKFDDIVHNMAWWLEYNDFAEFVEDYADIMTANNIEVPKIEKKQIDIFDILGDI